MGNEFGENLKRLRKRAGITQEQLAGAVGVTAQAVSKWELGSYPDASLLPAAADCLGVTVDELFGRERGVPSLESLLLEELNKEEVDEDGNLRKPTKGERMQRAFGLCHWLFYAYPEWENIRQSSQLTIQGNQTGGACSLLRGGEGMIFARLDRSLQYFLLMPRPEGGFDNPGALAYSERYVELFCFLGMPNALRVLMYLAEQPDTQFFSAQTLVDEIGLARENAEEIVAGLKGFGFVKQATLRQGRKDEEIYRYEVLEPFVFFMSFAHLLLNIPHSFSPRVGMDSEPYFWNSTYKKPIGGENGAKS